MNLKAEFCQLTLIFFNKKTSKNKFKNIFVCTEIRYRTFKPVWWIRIRIWRIHMFLGLPDPLLFCTDPDPSVNYFVTSF
jgi:hypothetical protein